MTMQRIVHKINGNGWVITLIGNVIWTTLLISALYWKLHEEVSVLHVKQAYTANAVGELNQRLATDFATKRELDALWRLGQEQHERLKDQIRRNR